MFIDIENLRYYSIQGSRLISFTNITRQGSRCNICNKLKLDVLISIVNHHQCNEEPGDNLIYKSKRTDDDCGKTADDSKFQMPQIGL